MQDCPICYGEGEIQIQEHGRIKKYRCGNCGGVGAIKVRRNGE